jgi:hypothetical protein
MPATYSKLEQEMSITKHITHYLTEEGKQALPAWLERLHQAALKTDGFDGIFLGVSQLSLKVRT